MLISIITLLTISSSSPEYLYKDIPAGIVPKQLEALNFCKLTPIEVQAGLLLLCGDFPFNGDKVEATFLFTSKGLSRMTIAPPMQVSYGSLIDALKKKYGKPESEPTLQDLKDVLNPKSGNSPTFVWRNGRVALVASKTKGEKLHYLYILYSASWYPAGAGGLAEDL